MNSLFVLFLLVFSTLCGTRVPFTDKPGVKFAYPTSTISYMLPKLLDFGSQFVETSKVPDQSIDNVQTPSGSFHFDISQFILNAYAAGNPTFSVLDGNLIEISSKELSIAGGMGFSYQPQSSYGQKKLTSFAIKNGTVKINKISGDFDAQIGAKIDSTQKSNIQILCTKFALHLTDFDVTIQGEVDPWVQTVIQTLLKNDLLEVLLNTLSSHLPKQIMKWGQVAVDSIPFKVDLNFYEMYFSYQLESLIADKTSKFISLGSLGLFQEPGIAVTGTPIDLPNIIDTGMCQIMFSDLALNSLGDVLAQTPGANYTMKDLFFEKTKYFKDIIPNLYYRYPDKDMLIVLKLDPFDRPKFTFKDGKIKLYMNVNQIWKVVLAVEGPIEVFTLETKLHHSIDFEIDKGHISGHCIMDSIETTVKRSFVGDFNVTDMADIIESIFKGIVTPIINMVFEIGLSLPEVEYVTLNNPVVKVHDGYFHVTSAFSFDPPVTRNNFKMKNNNN